VGTQRASKCRSREFWVLLYDVVSWGYDSAFVVPICRFTRTLQNWSKGRSVSSVLTVTCKSCRLSLWKLQLYFRDFLKSRYYITFSILYTKNSVWEVQTLLSTLYSHAFRKLDFHTLWSYHRKHDYPSMTILLPTSKRLRTRLFKLDRKTVRTPPIRSTYFSNTFLIILYDSSAKCSYVTQNYYNDSGYLPI